MGTNYDIIQAEVEAEIEPSESIFLEAFWECFVLDGKIQPLGWMLFITVVSMSVSLGIITYHLVRLSHVLDTISRVMSTL